MASKSAFRGMICACSATTLAALLAPVATLAQGMTYRFDLPSQDLGAALRGYAKVTHQQLSFDSAATKGRASQAVEGVMDADGALRSLLAGSGFEFARTDRGVILVRPARPQSGAGATSAGEASRVSELTVTGTHIAGVQPSSPLISVTQAQILDAGQNDLGEFAQSLTENFAGGQNPSQSTGTSGAVTGLNLTGASSFNLRGLGPDATLTLLNGRRLPYNGYSQATDLSQIPLAAVQRVDILLDGASAIYGSDAVAGVVNILLKPDFEGVTVTARGGGSTGGGDAQQQYSLVAGKSWTSGGVIAAYNYDRNSEILTSERNYSSSTQNPTTLYPPIIESSGFISAHQSVNQWINLSVDALYSQRSNRYEESELPAVKISNRAIDRSYYVSPKIDFELPKSWKLSIYGVASDDNSKNTVFQYRASGVLAFHGATCYCDSAQSVEADAGGPLFSLPGGEVKAALGGRVPE